MATMIITHQVSNFDDWKKAYEAHAPARKKAGFTSGSILRDESDRNKVTVILKNPNLDSAKAFAKSPDLKQAMERAGVKGKPEMHFLVEA